MLTFCRLGVSELIATQIVAVVFLGFGQTIGYDLYGSPCKLTDGTPGICTIVKDCTSVYQGLVTKTLSYDKVVENRCGFSGKDEIVCCKDRKLDPPPAYKAPPYLPPVLWIWDQKDAAAQKESSTLSDNTRDDDVNYWLNAALESKTETLDDKEPWNPEWYSPSIQPNPNSHENYLTRENLGVGKALPTPRNDTNRDDYDLFNDIFDIPANRGDGANSGDLISTRITDGAGVACVKYKKEFGVRVTFNILGGSPAKLGEFPHMAALGYPSTAANRDYEWNCGASLISDQYLITSAHCVEPDRPTIARLGKISIDTDADGAKAEDVDIEEVFSYPGYTTIKQYDDVALLRLNRKVAYTENILPACLNTNKSLLPNTNVIVTGWGTTKVLSINSKSPILLKANLTTVELSSCNQSYVNQGRSRRLPQGLMDNQFCAYDPDLVKDACEGDSGGPLQIVDDSGMSTIYGITSFGVSCAIKVPGVYSRVSSYVDWIESIVWP